MRVGVIDVHLAAERLHQNFSAGGGLPRGALVGAGRNSLSKIMGRGVGEIRTPHVGIGKISSGKRGFRKIAVLKRCLVKVCSG